MKTVHQFLTFGVLVTLSASAEASVVLTNIPGNDGIQSQFLSPLRQKAVSFQVDASSSYVLQSALLRLNVLDVAMSPVLTLHLDSGSNTPGALAGTFTNPSSYALGFGSYQFQSSAVVLPSTKYWLKLSGTIEEWDFDWAANSPGIAPTGSWTYLSQLFSITGGSAWVGSGTINSFELKAAPVPEPATMAALGLGIAGLLRRRTKKA